MHLTLGEFVLPLIKSLDTYNYLLKSHQRRAAIIAYEIGKELKLNQQQLVDLVIAASIHDLGALSVQDRDQLLEIDVSDPKPHCQMGYEILQAFQPFHNVAKIIQHHHIFYDELVMYNEDIPIQSHIIHLADRLEVYIDKDEPILDQREEIIREILDRKGTLFHPFVCGAFERVSRSSMFWLDINNKSQDWLFSQITFGDQLEVSPDIIEGFSTVMARIVDFRSRYTAAHSLTVGNVAQYIGELLQKETEYNTQLLIGQESSPL